MRPNATQLPKTAKNTGATEMSSTITMTSDELADLIRRISRGDGWLTVVEAASWARTTKETIYRWIHSGKLPSYRPPNCRQLVCMRDVERIIHRNILTPGDENPHQAALDARLAKRRLGYHDTAGKSHLEETPQEAT